MMSRAHVFSILFHVILIAGFFTEPVDLKKNQPEMLQFELVASGLTPKNLIQKNDARSRHSRKNVKSVHSILFPGYKEMFAKKIESDSRSDFAQTSDDIYGSDAPDFANQYNGMSMARIRFMKTLWREIDKAIIDSPYLSEYGHIGKVVLHFELTTEGQIVESRFRAHAEDSILKVVAARALRKALRNDKNELELPSENIQLQAQFVWADYAACNGASGTYQKSMSFCKYGENKTKKFSGSEKVSTYLNALRYGPGALEEIRRYHREEDHRKTNFDPFESFRRDPDFNLGS